MGHSASPEISICIVVENLPVPLDRRVWSEARALREAGYAVSVICPRGKESNKASYELLEGIHIYRHRSWEASGAAGYIWEYGTAFLSEIYLVLKVFRRTRFSILQGCNPPDNIFILALLLKPFGVRYIFDQHDLAPELLEVKFGKRTGILGTLTRCAEKCSFLVSKVSLATNESFKEIAIARGGMRADRVFVLRNCPDLKEIRPKADRIARRADRRIRVIYVGFMARQDGLDLLIDAIDHIVKSKQRKDIDFVLVGGGSMLSELRSLVGAKGLDAYVTFTGRVTHSDVLEYLSDSDIGVAPDPKTPMNDNSTMIKLFEYMAFGLPIVLFDLKEGRRTVGDAALYARPNDPIDFADRIDILIENAKLREELGSIGRRRVEECLNWETEKRNLLAAYSTALQV